MLDLVNEERKKYGLAPLCANQKLNDAAQRHSDDQAAHNFLDHTGTDGTSVSDRITQASYEWSEVAENVAAGQADVKSVMKSWMNSPGHRENILGDYTMFGTAYAYNADATVHHHWTQEFGTSDVEECDSGNTGSEAQYTLAVPKKPSNAHNTAGDEMIETKHQRSNDRYFDEETSDAPCTETPISEGTEASQTDASVGPPVYEVRETETPIIVVDGPEIGFSSGNEGYTTPVQSHDIPVVTKDLSQTETFATEYETSHAESSVTEELAHGKDCVSVF